MENRVIESLKHYIGWVLLEIDARNVLRKLAILAYKFKLVNVPKLEY